MGPSCLIHTALKSLAVTFPVEDHLQTVIKELNRIKVLSLKRK